MIKQKIHKCIMHNLRLSKIVANNLLITFEFIDHITKKGSFACTCTADFAGDSCDLELNACFTREEPCNETGTAMCENLDPFTSNSPFECVCKPGLGIMTQ